MIYRKNSIMMEIEFFRHSMNLFHGKNYINLYVLLLQLRMYMKRMKYYQNYRNYIMMKKIQKLKIYQYLTIILIMII